MAPQQFDHGHNYGRAPYMAGPTGHPMNQDIRGGMMNNPRINEPLP